MEDSLIVDQFLSRDEDAIKHVSEKYGKRIKDTALKITEDIRTSEECENDMYFEAWKRIPPHEPRNYLLPFLIKIVRSISLNRCISDNRLKRKGYIEELTSEMEQCLTTNVTIEDELDAKLLSEAISRFLRQQSREKCAIFLKRYFYGEKYSSIAKDLGYKENTVRVIVFNMRKSLSEYLREANII